MTLTAIANELNTTTMTIYRRLKKAGVNVGDLRDEKTGELTAAGASMIASLFDSPADSDLPQTDEQLASASAETRAAVLAAKLEGANALIEQLTNERDALREQLATVTAALQREQDDRRHERQLLTGDVNGEAPRRRGLFGLWKKK